MTLALKRSKKAHCWFETNLGCMTRPCIRKKDPHTAGLWPLFPYHHPTVPSSIALIPPCMVPSPLAASLLGGDTVVTPVELGPLA